MRGLAERYPFARLKKSQQILIKKTSQETDHISFHYNTSRVGFDRARLRKASCFYTADHHHV
jgi:hypothetical protein